MIGYELNKTFYVWINIYMKKIFLISTVLIVLFSCATALQRENIENVTFISNQKPSYSQYDKMRSMEDRISSAR